MKSNESFQLHEAWWKNGKPAILTGTGLSSALRSLETVDKKLEANKVTPKGKPAIRYHHLTAVLAPTYLDAIKALDAVDAARKDTIRQCEHNLLLKDVKAALQKDAAITHYKTALNQLIGNALEEEAKLAEDNLATETREADSYQRQVAALKARIDKAQKDKNGAELNKAAKEMGRVGTNIKEAAGSLVGNGLAKLLADLSKVLSHFPQYAGRFKHVQSGSLANSSKYKGIQAEIRELEDSGLIQTE